MKKVLVIDDDPLVTRLVRARLMSAGYEVVVRNEALGTARVILAEKPDVILLDINMPAITGDTLAKLMKRMNIGGAIPIIFHSADSTYQVAQKAREAGAVGCVPKTQDDGAFITKFEQLLAEAKAT